MPMLGSEYNYVKIALPAKNQFLLKVPSDFS